MQRYRVVILIVLFGILPVAAAFVFALFFLEEGEPPAEPAPAAEAAPPVEEAPPPAPEKPRVLAAVRTLPVGTLLRADDLTGVDLDLDPDAVRRGYVTVGEDRDDDAAAESLRGYAVREAIAAGIRSPGGPWWGRDSGGFSLPCSSPERARWRSRWARRRARRA